MQLKRRQIDLPPHDPLRQNQRAQLRKKESDLQNLYAERFITALFSEADRDNNGSIDLEELRTTAKRFDIGLQVMRMRCFEFDELLL